MKELLDEFNCTVTKENRTITLTYCHPTYSHLTDDGGLTYTGNCIFETHTMKGASKPIIQNIIIMTGCDMGDVIEYIYQKRGLNENDFDEVSSLIRDHSRSIVELADQDPHL